LQFLLAFDVLDKSAPGVSLTPRGEIVVNLEDQIRAEPNSLGFVGAPQGA
jgi:hypothetical protein